LELDQVADSLDVVPLGLAHLGRQEFDGLVFFAGLDGIDDQILVGDGNLACFHRLGEHLFAFLGNDEFFKLVEDFRGFLACIHQTVEFLLCFLVRLDQHGVADRPGGDVDLVDGVVGHHGLGKLVLDEVLDLGIERCDARDANHRHDDQERQSGGKADAETNADF
jgi:hypothetical protein